LNVERVLDSLNLVGMRTLLWKHYHGTGPGREPIDPISMFKAQLLKHLLQIPSDRRLAIRLKRDSARGVRDYSWFMFRNMLGAVKLYNLYGEAFIGCALRAFEPSNDFLVRNLEASRSGLGDWLRDWFEKGR
jgi:hypothetical protein